MTIGVDIGGTKVAAGLVSSQGEISHKTRVPMVATADAEKGFAAVAAAVAAIFDVHPKRAARSKASVYARPVRSIRRPA